MCVHCARTVLSRLTLAVKRSRKAERRVVLLFAEVYARHLYRDADCVSIQQFAEEHLAFSGSKTAQFVRLAKSFEEMPALRDAVSAGEVEWTKARELVRVASPATIDAWLEVARRCSRRVLERRILDARARARGADDELSLLFPGRGDSRQPAPAGEITGKGRDAITTLRGEPESPVPEEPPPPPAVGVPVVVRVRFTGEEYARYQAMLEAIRKSGANGTPAEVILDCLEARCGTGAGSSNVPPYRVVTYVCASCGGAHMPTDRGDQPVSPSVLAAQMSDAELVSTGERMRRSIAPSVRARVLARDGNRCRMKGCARTSFLELHHRIPISRGGTNDAENLVTLCSRCHRAVHERERLHPGTTRALFRSAERATSRELETATPSRGPPTGTRLRV